MPIDDSTFGKEADGSKNEDYCHYCYADGHFTKECTMDEMIELNLNYLDEIVPWFNNNYGAKLKCTNGEILPIGRNQLKELRSMFRLS